MKLGQILVRINALSPTTLEQVIETQSQWSRPLGEILLREGLISEDQLTRALQEQHWRRQGLWVID